MSPKLIVMTPPPKKKEKREKKKREREREKEDKEQDGKKLTEFVAIFSINELFNFVCFYAFLHFSGVELPLSTSSGKSELSECQECWFLAFC